MAHVRERWEQGHQAFYVRLSRKRFSRQIEEFVSAELCLPTGASEIYSSLAKAEIVASFINTRSMEYRNWVKSLSDATSPPLNIDKLILKVPAKFIMDPILHEVTALIP